MSVRQAAETVEITVDGSETREARHIPLPPDGGLSFDRDLCEILSRAWGTRQANSAPELVAVWPKATRAVSLTGAECALNCAHCGGHYLAGMTPLQDMTPSDATGGDEAAEREWAEVKSCLISGGCDLSGRVPLLAHAERLAGLRERFRLNMHVGLVTEDEAREVGRLADMVSFDLVGDDETIREVYGLNRTAADYFSAFDALSRHVPVVPHLCIGLAGGRLVGERRALAFLAERGVKSLAFIVFTPTPGSRYAQLSPPALSEVTRLLAEARLALPKATIHLGCMRPKGSYRIWLDLMAVRAGVNRIVQPTPWARALAESLGLTLVTGDECCVF